MSFLQWAIWGGGACVELLFFLELLRAGVFRSYPLLTIFAAWQFLQNVPRILAFVSLQGKTYYVIYWATDVLSWALLFFVVLELYHHVLQTLSGFWQICKTVIVWTGLGFLWVLSISITLAEVVEPQPLQWINNWLFLMLGSIRLLHAGLLATLLGFVAYFHLPTSVLFRWLSFGLLMNSVIRFVLAWARNQFGPAVSAWTSAVQALAYVGVVVALWWIVRRTRFQPELALTPAWVPERADEQLVLARLEHINAALLRALSR